jgi:hypothetical protein
MSSIMLESVDIYEDDTMSSIATLVQTVNSAGMSPGVWFRRLHIFAGITDYDDEDRLLILDHMHMILLYPVRLRELTFDEFLITNTTLAILRQSCASTLTKLDLTF